MYKYTKLLLKKNSNSNVGIAINLKRIHIVIIDIK